MQILAAFTLALLVSLLVCIIIVATRRLHGRITYDSTHGIQKLHREPTPRIGGIAVVSGALAGAGFLVDDAPASVLLGALPFVPAFVAGLLEDTTKRVGVGIRLWATMVSGLIFCLLSGYAIRHVDIAGADLLLSFPLFALLFTAFALAGIANAMNIIDGINGLSSGTGLIIMAGFACVAWAEGDMEIFGMCAIGMGALAGFLVVNFPAGKLFLGDAGAYAVGLALAFVAVALPARNPALSPLIGLLALAYPVVETAISFLRRALREDCHPGQADRLHLHSLFYRSRARQLAQELGNPALRAPLTSVAMWLLSLLSVTLMVIGRESSGMIMGSLVVVAVLYLSIYRRVALLRPREARERQPI